MGHCIVLVNVTRRKNNHHMEHWTGSGLEMVAHYHTAKELAWLCVAGYTLMHRPHTPQLTLPSIASAVID